MVHGIPILTIEKQSPQSFKSLKSSTNFTELLKGPIGTTDMSKSAWPDLLSITILHKFLSLG